MRPSGERDSGVRDDGDGAAADDAKARADRITQRLIERGLFSIAWAASTIGNVGLFAVWDTAKRDRRTSATRRAVILSLLAAGCGVREAAWLLDVDPGTVMSAKRKAVAK